MTPIAFQHIEPTGSSDKKRYPRKLLPPDREFLSAREKRAMRKVSSINRQIRHFNAIRTRLIDENAAGRGTVEWFARNEHSLPENVRRGTRFFVRSYEIQLDGFTSKQSIIEVLAASVNMKTAGYLVKNPGLIEETRAALKEGIHLGSNCLELKNKIEEIVAAQAKISAPN